jgi:hypothetical protein
MALVGPGLNDCEIARRTGIPVRTICGWRNGRRSGRRRPGVCGVCGSAGSQEFTSLTAPAYAYLLGLYLGDGHISRHGNGYGFSISLDGIYPRIIEECRAIRVVLPEARAGTRSEWVTRPCGLLLFPTLALLVSPARSGTQAPSAHRLDGLAAHRHRAAQAGASAWAHPFRRLPQRQPSEDPRRDVPVCEVLLPQRLRGHPGHLRGELRRSRRRVDAFGTADDLRVQAIRGRDARRVGRAEGVTMRGLEPPRGLPHQLLRLARLPFRHIRARFSVRRLS